MTCHGKVVGDFQRAPVLHLEAFLTDVVDHQFGQRLHVGRDDSDALGLHHVQGLHQRTGTGDDRRQCVVFGSGFLQPLL
ncbi:hypothetical protein D3C73_1442980 [compost metagenome]